MRAPYQVLVFPYFVSSQNKITFCIFKRSDLSVWQGISGGGEDIETPLDAAKREVREEAGIIVTEKSFVPLKSICNIPVTAIGGAIWGKDISEVPEYPLGLEVQDQDIQLSTEHTEYKWLSYSEALKKLEWQSNKIALTELNERILKNTQQKRK